MQAPVAFVTFRGTPWVHWLPILQPFICACTEYIPSTNTSCTAARSTPPPHLPTPVLWIRIRLARRCRTQIIGALPAKRHPVITLKSTSTSSHEAGGATGLKPQSKSRRYPCGRRSPLRRAVAQRRPGLNKGPRRSREWIREGPAELIFFWAVFVRKEIPCLRPKSCA
jgi:hypothetical protein